MKKFIATLTLIIGYLSIALLISSGQPHNKVNRPQHNYKVIGWATQSPNVQGVAYFQYTQPNQPWQYTYFHDWTLVSGSVNKYSCSKEVYLTSGDFISLNCIGLNTNAYSVICVVNLDTGGVVWLQSPCNAGPTFKINYILP